MSRLEKTFAALDHPALITFIMAGDPDHETCLKLLRALPEAGADIIELGMPFTDPAADGPVIQAAGLRALQAGANMHKTLELVQQFREENRETPLLLMGYANPLYAYGLQQFVQHAAQAGVDGLIIVDLPPEEDGELRKLAHQEGLDIIRLITPTTNMARLQQILPGAAGFLYYISIVGITGAAKPDPKALQPRLQEIRKNTTLPLAIGFGIRTPEDAKALGKIADAIVVGSAIVQTIADNKAAPDLTEKISTQVRALAQSLRK